MPDVRLVDANALHKVFDAMHAIPGCSHFDHLVLLGIKKFIDDTPTIDAVEVVRCKDCKESDYYSTHDPDGMYCAVWDTVVRCNGYCDHGAKMDGGAEC